MHLPSYNAEHRTPQLQEFIKENPLGILTTAIRHSDYPFLQSSHIPWVLDASEGEYGRLRGHIARMNPQSKAIIDSVAAASEPSNVLEEDVLILFNGPGHHYITPKFYRDTKPTTGKVVPTWNYEAVEVYGRVKVYIDSHSDETISFLTAQIADLSNHAETSVMGYGSGDKPGAWKVSDAPERYVELLRKNIIGIEIEITRMAGRFKMSQEKKNGDRTGVIHGLHALQTANGTAVSDMVSRRGAERDAATPAAQTVH